MPQDPAFKRLPNRKASRATSTLIPASARGGA
jgi:hypothetical protein